MIAHASRTTSRTLLRVRSGFGSDDETVLRDKTLEVFERYSTHARQRGVIICDTKFE